MVVMGSWELCRGCWASACRFQPEGAFLVGICRNLAKPALGLLGQQGSCGAVGKVRVWKANKFRSSACLAALCRDVTAPTGIQPPRTYLEGLLSPSEHFLDQQNCSSAIIFVEISCFKSRKHQQRSQICKSAALWKTNHRSGVLPS